jgi:hypothetical protein
VEQLRISEGGQTRLTLNPEELGRLDLLLEKTSTGWRLEIRVEKADTARQLQNQAQDLHDRLATAGLRLDELRLQVAAGATPPEGPAPLPTLLEAERGGSGSGSFTGKGSGDENSQKDESAERKSRPGGPGEDFASRLESWLRRLSEGESA